MPRMIPDIDPGIIISGEREMYIALRDQLPDEWVVRHHYPACWMRGVRYHECEADFIVAAPGMGLMFIEVKASHGYDSENGKWYRIKRDLSREPMERSPWDQATATKHSIVDRLSRKLGYRGKHDFPGIYGQLIAFPRGRVIGKTPSSVDQSLVLGYRHMDNLRRELEQAYFKWGGENSRGNQFTPSVMETCVEFLKDECRFITVAASEVNDDEDVIEELTKQQYSAFNQLLANNRVTVKGTAGSGKTLIAFWVAQKFAQQGSRVLFLCYNRQLASWLNNKLAGLDNIEIVSFFSYCRQTCERNNIPFNVPSDPQGQEKFWAEDAGTYTNLALDKASEGEKFDLVIVDEAQDFNSDWWTTVELSLKDLGEGQLYVFLDTHQSGVYGHGDAYPSDGMVTQELGVNCRNTKRITEYNSLVLGESISCFDRSPVGQPPVILDGNQDPAHRAQNVKKLVLNLLNNGFDPSQIAVLSPWTEGNPACSIKYIDKVDNIPIRCGEEELEGWLKGEIILGSTIMSFKGMEADCIIVTDVPCDGSHGFIKSDLYVAVSRAKHRLVILPNSEQSADQLRAY